MQLYFYLPPTLTGNMSLLQLTEMTTSHKVGAVVEKLRKICVLD